MQGQLSEHPIIELMHEMHVDCLSGALRLERERIKIVVYAQDGGFTFATANVRQLRLAHALHRWNAISEAEWEKLAVSDDVTDAELTMQLLATRALNENQIKSLQTRLAEEVLRFALGWEDGVWMFDARARLADDFTGNFASDARAPINHHRLLTEAARNVPDKVAASRLSETSNIISLADSPPPDVELLPLEAFVLSRVAGEMELDELLMLCGVGETPARALIYRLVLGGFLRGARPPRAFTTENAARFKASSANAKPPVSKAPKPEPLKSETNEDRMSALFAQAAANNYYAMLGVSHGATPERIKTAYYALAKRFHPDAFDRATPDDARARIAAAFVRIATAYETLKDASTRAAYDLKLHSAGSSTSPPASIVSPPAQPSGTPPTSAETHAVIRNQASSAPTAYSVAETFQQGLQALKSGNHALALRRFSEAARGAPNNAQYRAHYGAALAHDTQSRRQAEAELQAAVALAPHDGAYRVMLAEFYQDTGLKLRAVGELERFLQTHPQDATARRMLTKLQRSA